MNNNCFDLVVVGAGPAGVIAAKTASENGLRVALLERKRDITTIRRACATMLVLESDFFCGERMYFSQETKRMVFPLNGFSISYEGPYKNFFGWHIYSPNGKSYIRVGNYEENIKKGEAGRLSIVYDKGRLLEGILEDATACGLKVFPGTNVVNLEKHKDYVQVFSHEGRAFRAPFVIAADGVNSRIAKVLSLNEKRTFYGTLVCINFYLTGVKLPHQEIFITAKGVDPQCKIPYSHFILPSVYEGGDYVVNIGGVLDTRINYLERMNCFIYESPFSHWFEDPRINRKTACVENIWSPLDEPFKDNVLFAGDAAWTQEAETTGALISGLKAASAVIVALKNGALNREGVLSYINWWGKAFPGSHDYRHYLRGFALSNLFNEEDANYLYSLIKEPLPYNLNPFKLSGNMNMALEKEMPKIKRERPEIISKFQSIMNVPLDTLLASRIRGCFPNR